MSAENPKVTVLISTYNRPDYLRQAVQSVVDQSMTDWELLVMNDGGQDVAHVIESFGDARIRYFPDEENKGAAHRFNFGLNNARGEYITYLGDDDLFYPNHCDVLSRALDENPGIGLAYSDLYAVSCVKDEITGQRYVLDKRIQVSRDFNREFMFHYNHVLHVSLMHRKEAAFRVGCFDESVKVLIEWSLNRRLAFIYDFMHVPVPTGEYYMPVFKSDRISVVQRKDKVAYRHNLRKIRSNLPPEPWPKIQPLAIVYPIREWTGEVNEKIGDIIDNIDHPFRLMLVNNGTGLTDKECRESLGRLAELKNIEILTSLHRLSPLEAYRFGAQRAPAEYLFLVTDNLQVKEVPKRLFAGIEYLKNHQIDGVKWDLEQERQTNFDLLIGRDLFLAKTDPRVKDKSIDIQNIRQMIATGFKFDTLYSEYKRRFSKGEYTEAFNLVWACLNLPKGAPGIQFLIEPWFKCCVALKRYDLVEKDLRELIDRGYVTDNQIRLGRLLLMTNRHAQAIEAFQKGMEGMGLKDGDFDSPAFPINFPKELYTFHALMGMGEAYYQTGQSALSARMFHRASKLRANSHRPFLGFAKLFLASNQLDRAEIAMKKTAEREGNKDPETHRVLGKLCERRGRLDLAFGCYVKAFEHGPEDDKNIDPLYYAGGGLNRWDEVTVTLTEFAQKQPDSAKAAARLASIHFHLGRYQEAAEWAEKGLNLEPGNPILKGMVKKLQEAGFEIRISPARVTPDEPLVPLPPTSYEITATMA